MGRSRCRSEPSLLDAARSERLGWGATMTEPQKPSVGRIVHYYEVIDSNELSGPFAALVLAVDADLSGGKRPVVLSVTYPWGSGKKNRADSAIVEAEFSLLPADGCWSWSPRVP